MAYLSTLLQKVGVKYCRLDGRVVVQPRHPRGKVLTYASVVTSSVYQVAGDPSHEYAFLLFYGFKSNICQSRALLCIKLCDVSVRCRSGPFLGRLHLFGRTLLCPKLSISATDEIRELGEDVLREVRTYFIYKKQQDVGVMRIIIAIFLLVTLNSDCFGDRRVIISAAAHRRHGMKAYVRVLMASEASIGS